MPFVIYAFLAIQIIVVAYHDLNSKIISNKWSLINICFYIGYIFLFPEHYVFSLKTFIWPIGFFAAGFILYVLKIMGGGDSKYLTTFYLMIPTKFHEEAFYSLAIATVLVGGSLFIRNVLKNFDQIKFALATKNIKLFKEIFGEKFAFAPVIFISWMWFGWKIRNQFLY